jgi:hypothetical protein
LFDSDNRKQSPEKHFPQMIMWVLEKNAENDSSVTRNIEASVEKQ